MTINVVVTGAARLYRAASGGAQGYVSRFKTEALVGSLAVVPKATVLREIIVIKLSDRILDWLFLERHVNNTR